MQGRILLLCLAACAAGTSAYSVGAIKQFSNRAPARRLSSALRNPTRMSSGGGSSSSSSATTSSQDEKNLALPATYKALRAASGCGESFRQVASVQEVGNLPFPSFSIRRVCSTAF
jgi:hypothetical protein